VTRRLLLVRHAEAGPAARDSARRLTDRGRRDAAAIGRWLAEQDVVPDHVEVSPAVRAAETWSIAAGELPGGTVEPVTDDRIYANSVDDLLAVIGSVPSTASTLTVVGHNPSLAALVVSCGAAVTGFPTATVAVFDLEQPWGSVGTGEAKLSALTTCRG
jgi:phosphohistidine phosphatase